MVGHKKLYRRIDFHRNKIGIDAKVATIEYDPNRNARIALLHYQDGEKRYILYPRGLRVGETIVSDLKAPILIGNALPVSNMPLGNRASQHRGSLRVLEANWFERRVELHNWLLKKVAL